MTDSAPSPSRYDLHEAWNREATHRDQRWILAEDYDALAAEAEGLRGRLKAAERLITANAKLAEFVRLKGPTPTPKEWGNAHYECRIALAAWKATDAAGGGSK